MTKEIDIKFKEIMETAHKMKSGEIPTIEFDSIEDFIKACKAEKNK